MTNRIASIHLDRRRDRWELWFQSRPIAHGTDWRNLQRWGEEHGYAVVGPRADEVDESER